jgi:GTP-binding protein
MRRRGHQEVGVEKFSVMRSLGALQRADVAVLVIDVTEPLTAQDLHVAGFIKDAYKGLVVFLNKVDLIEDPKDTAEMEAWVRSRLKFIPGFPVIFGSALQKKGVTEMLEAVKRVYDQRQRRVSTSQLNRLLAAAMGSHVPPSMHGRRLSIFYGTQAEVNPPTFVIFVNDASRVHFSYRRYLENTLRREFGYDGTPIRLVFRGRPEVEERA